MSLYCYTELTQATGVGDGHRSLLSHLQRYPTYVPLLLLLSTIDTLRGFSVFLQGRRPHVTLVTPLCCDAVSWTLWIFSACVSPPPLHLLVSRVRSGIRSIVVEQLRDHSLVCVRVCVYAMLNFGIRVRVSECFGVCVCV